MIGNRLAHYEITSHLGSGGMGDVYQATDSKLGRSVAIKMLPEEFARDAARASRFEREARVLASLNHPSIAAIYGIEEANGRPFLVMELVPGATLAERIGDAPLSVPDSLAIALNIATALEAAHERGIIHRDLKPANIKVSVDGAVKLLDFGLAKAMSVAPVHGAPATMLAGNTELGTIMGTPAYMSPEQAMGQVADQRADIWAFGAVLYEMLTGRRAFPGTDSTETLTAVIKSEPDWSALPALPPLVAPFLKRCLCKNPKDRIHHIADMRLALAGAYDAPETLSRETRRVGASWRRLGWPAAAAMVAALAFAGAKYLGSGTDEVSAPISVRQLTFRQGDINNARFASDGQVVIYGASWDGEPYRLFTTLVDGFLSRPIDLPAADLLSVSNDNMLAIAVSRPPVDGFLPRGRLAQVTLAGGAPRAVADGVAGVAYAADGELAAIVRRVGVESQLEFPVGTVVYRQQPVIIHPSVSPDGRHVCFISAWRQLMLAERGGQVEVLADGLERTNRCAWNENGTEIWFSQAPGSATHANLEVVNVRTRERRVVAAFAGWTTLQDFRPGGVALITAGALRFSVHGAASATARERDLSVFDATRVGHLSTSGTEILLVENSTGARDGGLFLRPMDGSAAIQLGNAFPLAITADGAWVAVLGDGANFVGVSDIVTLVPTGPGTARTIRLPIRIEHGPGNTWGTNVPEYRTADFSDDGRRLLIPFASEGERPPRVYVHDLEAGWTRAATPEGAPGSAALSPDGRFVASSQPEGLFIYDLDSGEQRVVPGGADPGILARWSATESSVYMIEQDGATARLVARDLATGERRTIRDYRAPDPAGATRFDLWVSRDGNSYAYTLDRRLTNLFVVAGLQ